MTGFGWFQIFLYFVAVLLVTKPMGVYLYRVFEKKGTFLDFALRPIERLVYRTCGIDAEKEMGWKEYGVAMLLFSGVSLVLLYLFERVQLFLPWNPQKLANVAPDLAWNTAVSFTTNTNWQSYSGESTMSYLTQMAGLAYHNFASAAVGIALAIALIRGVARRESKTIGNFWVDSTRAFLWVLLPVALVGALFFVSQGMIQNLRPYTTAQVIEPQVIETKNADGSVKKDTVTTQVIAQGPLASQEVIKMYGTNGGGFFGANSAHPFENPTPVTNFVQMLLIFLVPAGLTYTLGRMTGSQRHGWAVWSAMAALFLCGVLVVYVSEARGNPLLKGVDTKTSEVQPGGNMEGKEVRFGIANSALFTTVTTDASCGAVNNQHDSLTPLGGMLPLINIMLGEIVFGGVGAGMYGVLVHVILAVFLAGLMVGR
ncbi:MAG TPA: potassium-transporting ATPase subunit KdpA, partial [Candidatus Sulfotelmatobacter sp.]|nr:potassium-transporting ATPase subunit KdpA [Candidatus Sulfotelmatobacter sp.]